MMTQSVMTQAVNLLGSATGNVTSKGKQSGSDFELVIDNSLKANQGTLDNTIKTAQKTNSQTQEKLNSKSDAVADDNQQTDKTAKTQDTKTATQKQDKTDAGTTTKEAVKDGEAEEVTNVNPETMEKIAAMLAAVKETVLDLLNMSPEQLDQMLSELGLEQADLLQPENLQLLVLKNSDQTNLLSVLTDENLANKMNQLLQAVDEIKNNSGLDISMEQVKSILERMNKPEEAGVDTKSEESGLVTENPENVQKHETVKVASDVNKLSDSEGNHKEVRIEVTKVTDEKENSSQSQADSNHEENHDLSSEKQYEIFLNNLTKAETTTQVDFSNGAMRVTELREIANQIVQRIRVTIQPEQTSMELQLNPEHLGKVNLSVQSKNGIMTAQFVVQNEISKEAIESQLSSLRETLNQQGIKVDAIEVSVATYSFDQNPNEQAGSQGETKKNSGSHITMEEAMNMGDDSAVTQETQDLSGILGSRVDYTA